MGFKRNLAAGLVAIAAVVPAQAADWYLGGSIGLSDWKASDLPAGASVNKQDLGYKLLGGVAFGPNFALEGGYANLGKAHLSYMGVMGDVKGYGLFVDAVGLLPVSSQVSLLGRLGVFNGHAKIDVPGASDSDSGTDGKFGLGVHYAATKTVGVRVEWERYRFKAFDERQDVDLWSVGVVFGF